MMSGQQVNNLNKPTTITQVLIRSWWLLIILLAVFVGASVYYSLGLPNIYRSEALLAPIQEKKAFGNLGSLGGLASAAGFSIGGVGVDKADLVVETLKSTQFLANFIKKNKLEDELIAGVGWNRQTDTFIYNPEVYSISDNKWLRPTSPDRSVIPSDEELVQEFKKRLSVNKDKSTDFIRLSIESYIPKASQSWLQLIIDDLNEVMRVQSIKKGQETLLEIERALINSKELEVKAILFQIADEKRKEIVIAEITPNYALMIVDSPTLPEKKSGPLRALIVLLSMVLATLLYCIFCVFIFIKKNHQNLR